MSEPLVVWEKWIDPFGQEIDHPKWTDYESNIDLLDSYDEDDELASEEDLLHSGLQKKFVKAIQTPMGIIPYNELTAPGSIFNFWVGHTNFNLNAKTCNIIEQAEGVEILDIFTRYRFRIGIGKCFNDSQTMSDINKQLYTALLRK